MEIGPGYKQTEVGVIPEEWEVKPLCAINFDISDGNYSNKYPKASDFKSFGIPFIRANNIRGMTVVDDDMRFITSAQHQELQKGHLKANDLLITTRGEIGKMAIVPAHHIGSNINAQLVRINTRDTGVDYRFLIWAMSSEGAQEQLKNLQTGSALKQLPVGRLTRLKLSFPPPPEQRAIAEALSDVDALIESLDQLIAKKRDIKQAAMQQLLTGQRRLPGFSGKWEERQLGDVVEKAVGGGTPSRTNPAFWGKGIPWVTVKDFATFHPLQAQESITKAGLESSASHLIPAGTLITATRMALGKAVIYEVDVAINQDLKALMLRTNCNASYLKCWFELNASMVDELGSGSTVKGISIADLKRLPFRLAPIDEQLAIVEVLSDMDGEMAALEQRRDKTRALKQGMMQELLTGRTRLI